MPALNFHRRFVQAILSGRKTQTIRKFRKYPFLYGQTLALYTEQRSRNCRKLFDAKCVGVSTITITTRSIKFYNHDPYLRYADKTLMGTDRDAFAREDGFADWKEMKEWWLKVHGLPFQGLLIQWSRGLYLYDQQKQQQ